ncbi:3'-5' exonuclease [Candidatus Pelagibacter communis]|jgi:DNA polymerase-3 subunit epsilon|uniref:3'-5' exonuclease n=1 Tax=Pelagibacter ubique TaxID=198252 RepID=UPI00094CB42F|nr:3'-5' exonuclease [Candidatus Pelagibacter ubique]MDB4827714.1 3'-5' exonuclease [Candidatus Pelagibacter sp.]
MDTEDLKFKKAMKELEKFVKILEKDKKFNMSNNVFISIETTGINTAADKIVEIAALKIDKNNLKSLFHQIINPEKEIDKNISNIIGYSNEELKKYPKITEINERFINFINSSTLIGHNNDFIFSFLNKELNVEISNEKLDVFEIAKKKYPNENNSTDNLKKKFNIIDNSTFSSSLNEVLELPKILDILSSKTK